MSYENPVYATARSINFPFDNEITSRSVFYATYPPYLRPFAQEWLRRWLQWFDGRVDGVHDNAGNIVSTRLGATLCQKVAQLIFGGGLLFSKKNESGVPKEAEEAAIKFISGDYNDEIGLDEKVAQAMLLMCAGGTSYIVENVDEEKRLWLNNYRMDEGYFDIDHRGKVRAARLINSKYVSATTKQRRHFILVEERMKGTEKMRIAYNQKFGEKIKLAQMPSFEEKKFYSVFNVYETTGIVTSDALASTLRPMGWSEIPENVRNDIKAQFGNIQIGVPVKLPFDRIGIVPFKYTEGIDNLPNLPYGQSMLQNIQAYLYLYDYMFGAMNTDLYLARGRVLAKKSIQNPDNKNNNLNWNTAFDNFLFTAYEGQATDEQKPVPVQFDLRSGDWESIKNNILESIAMTLEISTSTIAGWISDGSNRTAREISSEESSTALLVESKRKLITRPLNELVNDILQYNGYEECVEVKFSKSGETNTTLLLENTTNAYNSGLKSLYASVKAINPDMSEDEIEAEIGRIEKDQKNKQAMQQPLDFFNDAEGDFNGQEENSEGERTQVELADDSNRRMPNGLEDNNEEVTA